MTAGTDFRSALTSRFFRSSSESAAILSSDQSTIATNFYFEPLLNYSKRTKSGAQSGRRAAIPQQYRV
jgi:hypothetical protein